MWAILPIAAALLLVPASAPLGDAPLEIDILEGYLAVHDVASGTPHCARHSGYVIVPGSGPVESPTGGTNSILIEHHANHALHRDGPGHVPSTDDADGYGEAFLGWHEEFVASYQEWRVGAGHPALEGWDPATPMPPSLAYEFPGRGCTPERNEDPGVGLPTWATFEGGDAEDPLFGHTRLCEFADRNQLGKSISMTWHVEFHQTLGGDTRAQQAPRDPAFWAAHQFLIDHTRAFEAACLGAGGSEGADAAVEAARNVPTPAPLALVAVAAALALVARRR